MDYSYRFADKQIEKMEKKIAEQFKIASDEIEQKYKNYIKGYDEVVLRKGKRVVVHHKGLKERYEIEYKAFQDGKYTKEEFQAWYRSQIGRGNRWKELKNEINDHLVNANKIACEYVNGRNKLVFAENHNYEAYKIEEMLRVNGDLKSGISFSIFNENSVELLLKREKNLYKIMNYNVTKGKRWNSQKLENALLQGILQGDSVTDIANRFREVANMSKRYAIATARTAVTSAQNAGRQKTLEESQDFGVEAQKMWVSTLDSRTRESHQRLDGEVVDVNEPFSNGLMYPADPDGDPEEVMRCRCAERTFLPKYQKISRRRATKDTNGRYTQSFSVTYAGRGGTMSYTEWLAKKEKEDGYSN